ncbi:MAG: glycoside hydrolase family 18 protein [Eubacteriales bacterium]|nr:glycoside hydrolase family 18 protein [Eubacteriales bacterium]
MKKNQYPELEAQPIRPTVRRLESNGNDRPVSQRPVKQRPIRPKRVKPKQTISDQMGTFAGRVVGGFQRNSRARVLSILIVMLLVISTSIVGFALSDQADNQADNQTSNQADKLTNNQSQGIPTDSGTINESTAAASLSEDPFWGSAAFSREKILPEDELEQAIIASEHEAALLALAALMPKPTETTLATTTQTTTQTTTKQTTVATTTETTLAPTEAPVAEPVRAPTSNSRIIGYYGGWKSLEGYTPDNIDGSKLTHVLYAFAYIDSNMRIGMGSTQYDPSNFAKLRALKERNPHLKTLISVGGWDWSGRFSDAALTEDSRTTFANSCVDFILKHGFDGVDLDWEYPVRGGQAGNIKRPEDKQNFTLLMQKIREKFDAQSAKDGRPYLLSFAGGGTTDYSNDVELDKLGQIVDFAMIMSYDYHGKWDPRTDFNAPIYAVPHSPKYQINYTIDTTVNNWLNRGMPAEKLVLGVPFYGIKYVGVTSADNGGFYQDFDTGWAIAYKDIAEKYLTNGSYTRYFHDIAKVPWLFDGSTFISYDDPESIGIKVDYIHNRGLGGAMIWQLAQDDSHGTLMNALFNAMN